MLRHIELLAAEEGMSCLSALKRVCRGQYSQYHGG